MKSLDQVNTSFAPPNMTGGSMNPNMTGFMNQGMTRSMNQNTTGFMNQQVNEIIDVKRSSI